jgi:hypothetical protein
VRERQHGGENWHVVEKEEMIKDAACVIEREWVGGHTYH